MRIGNGAFDQRQNDVYGAVLDSILLHTKHSQRLPRRLWPIVQAQAGCASEIWTAPDQGMTLVVAELHRSLWIRGDSVKRVPTSLEATEVYPDMAFQTIEQGLAQLV